MMIIFLLLFSVTCSAKSDKFYRPFDLMDHEIQTILNTTILLPVHTSQPADISFICADIKYKDGALKFCELGDAIYMTMLRNIKLEINGQVKTMHSPPWGMVWHYLKQFDLPIWFIGPPGAQFKTFGMNKNILAIDELKKLGGQYISGLDALKKSTMFLKAIKKDFKNPHSLQDHRGVIIYCAEPGEQDSKKIRAFKKQYPGFIFINEALHSVVCRKDSTYQLFYDSGLADFIPYTKFYDKTYNRTLIQDILRDFSSEYLVIKPVAGSASKGVIIIPNEKLDSTLSLILKSDKQKLNKNNTPWLSEWAYDNNPRFMVSEYVPSKILMREGKPYDPTMRIIFMLRHDQGNVFVTLIAGFWKIPEKSLIDQAPLTEKHVTRPHLTMNDQDEFHRGILVEKEDLENVRNILNGCLPVLYTKILAGKIKK